MFHKLNFCGRFSAFKFLPDVRVINEECITRNVYSETLWCGFICAARRYKRQVGIYPGKVSLYLFVVFPDSQEVLISSSPLGR